VLGAAWERGGGLEAGAPTTAWSGDGAARVAEREALGRERKS